ncbi:MAG: nitrate reductase subunit beta [Cellulomonas sp.]|jgi:nitrate reductase beta subunit|nr:nitrate reductase subunit beta [Cellulomonas sp.]
MRVKAQVGMVMNLDKCIGCHTCSVTCKQTWTNRDGVEYVWFNNVETKPGIGYPVRWEDQDRWKGGWELDRSGRLRLRSGRRAGRLTKIFANPDLPSLDDYYEPVTYDYDTLLTAPPGQTSPSAQPISVLTGEPTPITWGPNWEDDLSGSPVTARQDPNLRAVQDQLRLELEHTFMFYLPRLCNHCLNPACVASCPSGAMYKREQDGIVLVDQDRCRGWRMCVTGCPYKKVYINHRTGQAEKCTFCFPRLEAGQPTVCSLTCVGRLRYLGIVLYDADRVDQACAVQDPQDLIDAQRGVFLDPDDPEVAAEAAAQGIPPDWLDAARRSPVWALAMKHRVALPLHPEHRTLPMVWYIPPLSPVLDATGALGGDEADADDVFAAVHHLRIPVDYLAELFTAGDSARVAGVLMKLAAVRTHMRGLTVGGQVDQDLLNRVGASGAELEALYRLLGIAKMADRYVVPKAHEEDAARLGSWASTWGSGCALDVPGGPGMGGDGAAVVSGPSLPVGAPGRSRQASAAPVHGEPGS